MDAYRVKPGAKLNLGEWDPGDKSIFPGDKRSGKEQLKTLNRRLEVLQELLFAEKKRKMLLVLQGMDTSGKDGTIRHVFDGVNPQGVKVASFGKPTRKELSHDYLWRVHKHTPEKGQIVLFNRSHYEDVLVVRVHSLVPEVRWRKRYEHIRGFEKMLADEGVAIMKFFLHISPEEQKSRLQARLDIPEKNWKFNKGDLKERMRWTDYITAFEDAISETSTEPAPWYIIPSDRKWVRNLVIANLIIQKLEGFDMQYPEPEDGLDNIVIPDPELPA